MKNEAIEEEVEERLKGTKNAVRLTALLTVVVPNILAVQGMHKLALCLFPTLALVTLFYSMVYSSARANAMNEVLFKKWCQENIKEQFSGTE